MSIPPALRFLKADWIWVVTGTGFSVVILAMSYVPLGQSHPWIPWSIFVVMWSFSWGWAFVRSWNREHDKVILLAREFIFPALDVARQALSGTTVEFDSEDAEVDYYFNKLRASARGITKELLRELLSMWKQRKRIISANVF